MTRLPIPILATLFSAAVADAQLVAANDQYEFSLVTTNFDSPSGSSSGLPSFPDSVYDFGVSEFFEGLPGELRDFDVTFSEVVNSPIQSTLILFVATRPITTPSADSTPPFWVLGASSPNYASDSDPITSFTPEVGSGSVSGTDGVDLITPVTITSSTIEYFVDSVSAYGSASPFNAVQLTGGQDEIIINVSSFNLGIGGTGIPGGDVGMDQIDAFEVRIEIEVIPEPSAGFLLAGGASLLLLGRRRLA